MTDSNDDFWPDLTGEPTVKAPLLILREQAAKLGAKTSNIVEAEVTASPGNNGYLDIRFMLKAPALNGYEYALLSLRQPADLYPVSFSGEQRNDDDAEDEKTFRKYLEDLLKSQRTVNIIRNLIAQSKNL